MVKILLVDDVEDNNVVLKMMIQRYMQRNKIEDYLIDVAVNGEEAIEKELKNNYDIIFLDIMMPVMNGLDALAQIRYLDLKVQPIVIMVTALNDDITIEKEKNLGANAYVHKPYERDTIFLMLDTYLPKIKNKQEELNSIDEKNDSSETTEEDDFLDFDEFDDFDDLDDFNSDEISEQKDMMDKFNQSHKKVPASEFLKDYPDLTYILQDIDEIEDDINEIIDTLDVTNIFNKIDEVIYVFNNYERFLNSFVDFYELATSLNMLENIIKNTDFTKFDEKKLQFIVNFIVAILKDLQNWKEHVFVLQDAVDVFYINASTLNSCIQLEALLKKD